MRKIKPDEKICAVRQVARISIYALLKILEETIVIWSMSKMQRLGIDMISNMAFMMH